LILLAIGVLILADNAYTDTLTDISQEKLRGDWQKATEKALSGRTDKDPQAKRNKNNTSTDTTQAASSERKNISANGSFARIVVPKIRLDAIVVEGVEKEDLARGPGHMEETAYPGEIGNVVISGHRVTYSRPFYDLNELERGDPIRLLTSTSEFIYYVVGKKVVKPTDVSVIQPTSDRTLTLITCNPRYSSRTRLVIIAKMRSD